MPEEQRPGTSARLTGTWATMRRPPRRGRWTGRTAVGAGAVAARDRKDSSSRRGGETVDMRIERRGRDEPVVDESGQDPTPRGDGAGCQGWRGGRKKGARRRAGNQGDPAPVPGGTEADGSPGAETKTTDLASAGAGNAPASSPCGPMGPPPSMSSQPTCTRPWGGWTHAGQIGRGSRA